MITLKSIVWPSASIIIIIVMSLATFTNDNGQPFRLTFPGATSASKPQSCDAMMTMIMMVTMMMVMANC
jgi:hypothetical protein